MPMGIFKRVGEPAAVEEPAAVDPVPDGVPAAAEDFEPVYELVEE